ncbi:hypothetical protein M5K25_026491 [Dendrobium thyrsiflorum]|uniref:Gnk2-homologous domain-containing protein n=1 Tax=Dendrobium thyrsiflorum TaxID=117978 RepID=A0ABD0TXP6_DENTH
MAIPLLFLLSLFASPAKADPLYRLCGSSSDIFTRNSTNSSNLNLLLSTLYTNASATGFATFTTGSVRDRFYGLTFCRGDIDIANCSSCISTAISDIEKLCPNNGRLPFGTTAANSTTPTRTSSPTPTSIAVTDTC